MKKVGNISKRGGARKGAGRPSGQTKKKISISVNEAILKQSLKKWKGKASRLIENLLQNYIN